MTVETDKDLQALRRIGRIVAECLQHMGESIEPGMTTSELDQLGDAFLARHGARSAPRLTYDFPGATCISINNEVAHGIPGSRKVKAGDAVNIDVSAELDGYFADTGATFLVPPETEKQRHLCDSTRLALANAMKVARANQPLNGIGKAIEDTARKAGLSIIRNLGSHGVGRKLHEAPEFIPSFHAPRDKRRLKEGMVITIEPFLSTGPLEADEAADGWTLFVPRPHLAAQYEHTLVITKGAPLVMTQVG